LFALDAIQDIAEMKIHPRPGFAASADLIARRKELLQRLNDGDAHIASAKRDGVDTSRWETLWIDLLREYEQVCRDLNAANGAEIPQAA
jgi:hypothetical protein